MPFTQNWRKDCIKFWPSLKKKLKRPRPLLTLSRPDCHGKVPADARKIGHPWPRPQKNKYPSSRATPAQVVEGAISGWYQDFLRRTYENWPGEKRIWKVWWICNNNIKTAEMLSQHCTSSESGDRVVRDGEKCIRLSTIHQSKGLEYPHVFIIGLRMVFSNPEQSMEKVTWKKNFMLPRLGLKKPFIYLPNAFILKKERLSA